MSDKPTPIGPQTDLASLRLLREQFDRLSTVGLYHTMLFSDEEHHGEFSGAMDAIEQFRKLAENAVDALALPPQQLPVPAPTMRNRWMYWLDVIHRHAPEGRKQVVQTINQETHELESCRYIEPLRHNVFLSSRIAIDTLLASVESKEGKGEPASTDSTATYSEGFASVNWFGTVYTFAKGLQAESVRALWEAWKDGAPGLSEQVIREKAGSSNDRFRLEHVFRPTNKRTGKRHSHPAWGTMIQSVGKGVFALSRP